jgi:hypothetical protein
MQPPLSGRWSVADNPGQRDNDKHIREVMALELKTIRGEIACLRELHSKDLDALKLQAAEYERRMNALDRTSDNALSKTEYEIRHKVLIMRVEDLTQKQAADRSQLDTMAGKGVGLSSLWLYILGVFSLISSIIGISGLAYGLLNHK